MTLAQDSGAVKLRSIKPSENSRVAEADGIVVADIKDSNNVNNNGDDGNNDKDYIDEPINLPQSTHTFLFSEDIFSLPYAFAILLAAMSFTCLVLALQNNLCESSSGNIASVPVQVLPAVKVAQYVSLFIGLLMEEEIPTALYMLRMISLRSLKSKLPQAKFWKFIFSALVRLALGYAFLFNMLIVILQSDTVIDIFYDLLALQFVQQLDDIGFNLCKMEALGQILTRAACRKCFHADFQRQHFLGRFKNLGIFLKTLYFCNLAAGLIALTYVTMKQRSGEYQPNSISVTFGDEVWKNAVVVNSTGGFYTQDLIFSHFNGVYVKNGTHDGRPVYTEQRKFDNSPFEKVIGAEIKYCANQGIWALTHSNIKKSVASKESKCDWLVRTTETTTEYNLLDFSGSWSVWNGKVSHGADIRVVDNECENDTDCNLNGVCTDGKCLCYPTHFGIDCQHREPCHWIRGDQNDIWGVVFLDDGTLFRFYERPIFYYQLGHQGLNPPEKDTAMILAYTGNRYYGLYYEGLKDLEVEFWIDFAKEIHAFWDPFVTETYIITDPTTSSTPIGLDIYFVVDRGERYGPFGKLKPYAEVPGSGYFSCWEDEFNRIQASGNMTV